MRLKRLNAFPAVRTLPTALPSPRQYADAHAIKTGFTIEIFHANQLLESLLKRGEVCRARKLFDEMPQKNTFTSNRMIFGYAKLGHFEEARRLFDVTAGRSIVTWTIMVGACSQSGSFNEALVLYREMLRSGLIPDRVTIVALLSSCQSTEMVDCVLEVHAHVVKFGFDDSVQVSNTLVDSYCKSGLLGLGKKLFDEMPDRDSVTYNALLVGCSKEGVYNEAVELFIMMREEGLKPSQFTFSGVLSTATGLDNLALGLQVHSLVVRTNFHWNVFVVNSLLDFYSKSDRLGDARELFEEMADRDNVSYNVMISGYSWKGMVEEVSKLFQELQFSSFDRKLFPFASLLSVAGSLPSLETGKRIHAQVIVSGAACDDLVANALIDMYAKCRELGTAELIFSAKSQKNAVSWTAIISGYVQNGLDEEALKTFCEMRKAGAVPDRATFSSVLSASAELALLVLGRQLHCCVLQLGLSSNVFVGSALLDMYAKCGCLGDTQEAFREISNPNIVSWNALVAAHAQNGRAREAVGLFDEMVCRGIKPDSVTFLSILSACSHAGFVEKGLEFFDAIEKPTKEHYACAVDLLGRVGRFDDVESLLNRMPFAADDIIWNSVLNSCRKHGKEDLAKRAADKLFGMDLSDAAPYVIMSNIYSRAGRWEEAAGVKKLMRERGVRKETGYSWVETKDKIYVFSSGDETNPRFGEIWTKLEELGEEMKKAGYKPDTSCVLKNLDDEEIKADALRRHSERLAIGFALITFPPGTPIRVMKNLRACADCHEAIKVMSKVLGREITVRDSSRFHHFKAGICSCRDYW